MSQSPRAGQPASPSDLVDVGALLRAYADVVPDPSDPAQRVAFGTSGHRGSAFRGCLQRGAHPGHHRGHLPLPCGAGLHRAPVHRPRHARAVRARLAHGARGPGRQRRRGAGRQRRRVHADAGGVARDPRRQPRPDRRPGGRHRRHPFAQPARGRRLQVQPAQRRAGRHRCHRMDPGRGEPDPRGAGERGPGRCPSGAVRARASGGRGIRLPGHVRRGPAQRGRHGGDRAPRGSGWASTRWAVPPSPTGARSASATAWT